MQEIVKEGPAAQQNGLLSKAVTAGTKAARAGVEGYCAIANVSHKFDEGLAQAKRLARRGRNAAADAIDETAYRIKRDPLRSVALTFSAGLGIGMLTGWLLTRSHRA